jgi:hypothetical protein
MKNVWCQNSDCPYTPRPINLIYWFLVLSAKPCHHTFPLTTQVSQVWHRGNAAFSYLLRLLPVFGRGFRGHSLTGRSLRVRILHFLYRLFRVEMREHQ